MNYFCGESILPKNASLCASENGNSDKEKHPHVKPYIDPELLTVIQENIF